MNPKEFPLGADGIDTLIVCHDWRHRQNLAEALQIKARYVIPGDPMLGWNFKRIIIFNRRIFYSDRDRAHYLEWLRFVEIKLLPDGQLFNL